LGEGPAFTEVVSERTEMLSGTETILVVEDDDMVRDLVALLLTLQGYTVLKVTEGNQALVMCQSYPSQIDLILTDSLIKAKMCPVGTFA